MKKHLKNKLILTLLAVLIALPVNAQERDPFSPNRGGMMSAVKDLVTGDSQKPQTIDGSSPMTSVQLSGYKVVGTMTSDEKKLASVKAINGVSYMVGIGDDIGSEGGKVKDITVDGIVVQTQEREVKLPVSNKIEVPLDAKAQ